MATVTITSTPVTLPGSASQGSALFEITRRIVPSKHMKD
jgi:hypothetical protein